MATGVLATPPILQFFLNTGAPAAGGTVLTQVGGINTATYQDSGLTTPLPNPIPLNSRGEVSNAAGISSQLFLTPNVVYTFTLFDAASNQIWVASYVNGVQVSSSSIGTVIYPRSQAEINAGVTPTNLIFFWGDVRRYGAVGGGTTDDSAAFASAALVSGTHPMLIYKIAGDYKVTTPFVLPANAVMQGFGMPYLKASVAGTHIASAVGVGPITVSGIGFQGIDSSTPPLNGFGGYSPNNTGLLTIDNCTDVRVYECVFNTFPNGLTVQGNTRMWILHNYITHFGAQVTGGAVSNAAILSGSSIEFVIDHNTIDGCDMPAGSVFFPSYGISVTGSSTQKGNSVSNNRIWNIPSWDAIGSHDIYGINMVGNDIRNVRKGIDLGHFQNTNLIQSITVADNYIEATTVDMWNGTSVDHGGIEIVGFSATGPVGVARITNTGSGYVSATYNNVPLTGGSGAGAQATIVVSGGKCVSITITAGGTNYAITDTLSASNANLGGAGSGLTIAITPSTLVNGVTITGNTIRGFFNLANGVAGGTPGSIVLANAAHCTVTGNNICDVGSMQTNSNGVFLNGLLAQVAITNNVMHGDMQAGAVRLATATIDSLSVIGNEISQVTAANGVFVSTGSTVSALALYGNASNSTNPIQQSTSTLTYSGSDLIYSGSWTPGNIANGSSASTSVALSGVNPGDFMQASISSPLLGCAISAGANGANVAQVVINNNTGGAANINAGAAVTLQIRVRRQFT